VEVPELGIVPENLCPAGLSRLLFDADEFENLPKFSFDFGILIGLVKNPSNGVASLVDSAGFGQPSWALGQPNAKDEDYDREENLTGDLDGKVRLTVKNWARNIPENAIAMSSVRTR
jgi:hypothetical protein